jgi:hypothetical protein
VIEVVQPQLHHQRHALHRQDRRMPAVGRGRADQADRRRLARPLRRCGVLQRDATFDLRNVVSLERTTVRGRRVTDALSLSSVLLLTRSCRMR